MYEEQRLRLAGTSCMQYDQGLPFTLMNFLGSTEDQV